MLLLLSACAPPAEPAVADVLTDAFADPFARSGVTVDLTTGAEVAQVRGVYSNVGNADAPVPEERVLAEDTVAVDGETYSRRTAFDERTCIQTDEYAHNVPESYGAAWNVTAACDANGDLVAYDSHWHHWQRGYPSSSHSHGEVLWTRSAGHIVSQDFIVTQLTGSDSVLEYHYDWTWDNDQLVRREDNTGTHVYAYDADGQLASETHGSYFTEWSWDDHARPTESVVSWNGAWSSTQTWTYTGDDPRPATLAEQDDDGGDWLTTFVYE